MTTEQAYDRGFDDGYDGFASNDDRVPEQLRSEYLHGFADGEIAAEREGIDPYQPAGGPVDAVYFTREMAP